MTYQRSAVSRVDERNGPSVEAEVDADVGVGLVR